MAWAYDKGQRSGLKSHANEGWVSDSGFSRVAETARPARGGREFVNFDQLSVSHRCDDKLCDAFPRMNCESLCAQVDQNDFDLAAIIGIDSAWRVYNC